MLGTGLAGLLISHRFEDAAEKPLTRPAGYRVQTLMVVPAANASEHAVETRTSVALSAPEPEPMYFSARELEVVARIAAGATSVEIAEQLHISVHTVKNHRKNILRKAGCRNSGQLINRCIALGLV